MNFRFRPDLASPAEPSMSIRTPPSIAPPDALAFGLRLSPSAKPLAASNQPPAFTGYYAPGLSGSCGPRLASFAASPVNPAINSRLPTGSSVKETLLLPNLWMQVQIPLNSVDFTRHGAALRAVRPPCTKVDAFNARSKGNCHILTIKLA